MTHLEQNDSGISRRTIVKGAAWSLPVVALAVASPAAAASPTTDVGAFTVEGTCGTLGLGALNSGFILTASATSGLPVGTQIQVNGTGIANLDILSTDGLVASLDTVSPTSRTYTLTAPLAPSAVATITSLISVGVIYTLTASVLLPDGYIGTGSTDTASVQRTQVTPISLCTAA